MNDKFNEQKDFLLSIKREISLLQQQVDYLIRNEQPLGLLDLDVMMNRIHTLYDQMCGVNLESEECGIQNAECGMKSEEHSGDEEELPVGLEEIRSLFGIEEEKAVEEEDKMEDEVDELEEEYEMDEEDQEILTEEDQLKQPDEASEEEMEENEDAYFVEEVEDVEPEEPINDFSFILNFEPVSEEESPKEPEKPEVEITEELKPEEEPFEEGETEKVKPEEEETIVEQPKEKPVYTPGDQIEIVIPAYEETSSYQPIMIGDMEDQDDNGFELDTPDTVGERYQQRQEETVGEKLQHGNVKDLQGAIGINDKFLFVNELFSGSMEKYNRSIENLNDLKTLNGALIYLNELRIELQWNSSNEAYKKLLELVHRKFEA